MVRSILQKSLSLLLKQQTNILSAAFIIMVTVIISQFLGLIRQRLLVSIFGASNTVGIYLYSSRLPDFLFQVIIASALSTAFIPVFSDFLAKKKEREGHAFASNLLCLSLAIFTILSIVLIIFSEYFCRLIAPGLSFSQIALMANLMRIMVVGQLFFIVASVLAAILQSYNHFFIPGIALATYNLGIIIGIVFLSRIPGVGIYSAAYGVIIGALLFVIIQLPIIKNIGFLFQPSLSIKGKGMKEVWHLMGPRTLSTAVYYLGIFAIGAFVSLIPNGGRNYVIFDYAQTLAFAPVFLFGQTIAQAAFPILSRQKDDHDAFKATFITSFTQMLYIILPFSVLFLVLRIPIVRLVYGVSQFDWPATVLTGRTLAYFSLSIFAQALVTLVMRSFYALHDTMVPLVINILTTILMTVLAAIAVLSLHRGVESIALSYSIASIISLLTMLFILNKRIGGFIERSFVLSLVKIFFATLCTAFALYIPIKLLDQLVFDTTKTINLVMLTGISSLIGLCLYLFLTWFLSVEEAKTFVFLFKKVGNWRDILGKSEEPIDQTRLNP